MAIIWYDFQIFAFDQIRECEEIAPLGLTSDWWVESNADALHCLTKRVDSCYVIAVASSRSFSMTTIVNGIAQARFESNKYGRKIAYQAPVTAIRSSHTPQANQSHVRVCAYDRNEIPYVFNKEQERVLIKGWHWSCYQVEIANRPISSGEHVLYTCIRGMVEWFEIEPSQQ